MLKDQDDEIKLTLTLEENNENIDNDKNENDENIDNNENENNGNNNVNNMNENEVKAKLNDGILTVSVTKLDTPLTKRIINIE